MNAFAAACDEMRPAVPVADRNTPVFCPKPRRLSPLVGIAEPVRPPRWHASHQADFFDSKTGADLLDIFRGKGGEEDQLASSPPFFCGSPPSRAANPVVHDARFGEDGVPAPFVPLLLTQSGPPISPSKAVLMPSSASCRRPCGSRVLIASAATAGAAAASLLWPRLSLVAP